VANTPAYYNMATIKAVKMLIVKAPEQQPQQTLSKVFVKDKR
jgi:hypothetical protein